MGLLGRVVRLLLHLFDHTFDPLLAVELELELLRAGLQHLPGRRLLWLAVQSDGHKLRLGPFQPTG